MLPCRIVSKGCCNNTPIIIPDNKPPDGLTTEMYSLTILEVEKLEIKMLAGLVPSKDQEEESVQRLLFLMTAGLTFQCFLAYRSNTLGFPGGSVAKSACQYRRRDFDPDLGRSHCAPQLLRLCSGTQELKVLSPRA